MLSSDAMYGFYPKRLSKTDRSIDIPTSREQLAFLSATPTSIFTKHVAVAPSSSHRHFEEKMEMSDNQGSFPSAGAL